MAPRSRFKNNGGSNCDMDQERTNILEEISDKTIALEKKVNDVIESVRLMKKSKAGGST